MRYRSISVFILYFFYKNVALTMPQYFYAYYNGYSAMTVFDEWYIQLYNIVFTSMPVILLGVFDWDIHPQLDGPAFKACLPSLYYTGQQRLVFNLRNFTLSQFYGLVHATIIFFIIFFGLKDAAILNPSHGAPTDLWTSSLTTFTALVIVVNLNLVMRIQYFTWWHFAGFAVFSIASYFGFMWFTNYVEFGWTQYSVIECFKSPLFYLAVGFAVATCFIIDLSIKSYLVLIAVKPTSYLRRLIASKKSIEGEAEKAGYQVILEQVQE